MTISNASWNNWNIWAALLKNSRRNSPNKALMKTKKKPLSPVPKPPQPRVAKASWTALPWKNPVSSGSRMHAWASLCAFSVTLSTISPISTSSTETMPPPKQPCPFKTNSISKKCVTRSDSTLCKSKSCLCTNGSWNTFGKVVIMMAATWAFPLPTKLRAVALWASMWAVYTRPMILKIRTVKIWKKSWKIIRKKRAYLQV